MNLLMRGLGATAFAAVLGLSAAAEAQTDLNAPDLVFPREANELSLFSPLAMGIWKPEGNGPFPAVIIVHSCGGVKGQIGYWRKEAIKRGYVVLVMDSFSSRGSPSCRPRAPVTMDRGVKDIFDATAHLGALPFVDKSRTLVLMGGQDTDSLAEICLSRLQKLKERSAPAEWHVFKDATHCWDCSDQHNHRWTPPWAEGRSVVYLYDSAVTAQSVDLVFEFFGRRLPATSKN